MVKPVGGIEALAQGATSVEPAAKPYKVDVTHSPAVTASQGYAMEHIAGSAGESISPKVASAASPFADFDPDVKAQPTASAPKSSAPQGFADLGHEATNIANKNTGTARRSASYPDTKTAAAAQQPTTYAKNQWLKSGSSFYVKGPDGANLPIDAWQAEGTMAHREFKRTGQPPRGFFGKANALANGIAHGAEAAGQEISAGYSNMRPGDHAATPRTQNAGAGRLGMRGVGNLAGGLRTTMGTAVKVGGIGALGLGGAAVLAGALSRSSEPQGRY